MNWLNFSKLTIIKIDWGKKNMILHYLLSALNLHNVFFYILFELKFFYKNIIKIIIIFDLLAL